MQLGKWCAFHNALQVTIVNENFMSRRLVKIFVKIACRNPIRLFLLIDIYVHLFSFMVIVIRFVTRGQNLSNVFYFRELSNNKVL